MSDLEDTLRGFARDLTPEQIIGILHEKVDTLSRDDAEELLHDTLPTTDSPGRHSMQYCLLCNPHWNGAIGEEGTEAIGKYKVPDIPGEEQLSTGWHGLCSDCVADVQRNYDVVPLPGHEDHPVFDSDDTESEPPVHECTDPSWTKRSLVTEDGGFDWVQCNECGIWAKRPGPDRYEIVGYDDPR